MEKDFYFEVEKPQNLKHILYGDSVSEDMILSVMKKNVNFLNDITFNQLWNYLINDLNCNVNKSSGKEYISIKNEFKILTYSKESYGLYLVIPEYIVRHKIKEKIISLETDKNEVLKVTKRHSVMTISKNQFVKEKPENCKYLLKENPHLRQIDLSKELITKKSEIDYDGYVYDICIPQTQVFFANGFLVHNTDSIFIVIPEKNLDEKSLEEQWNLAEKHAKNINDLIIDFTKNTILKRCNILPDHNRTFFKTELLMESIMFLDVKKNYAYKLLVKEGKILEKPKIDYTGIQVIKSDTAKITQNLLVKLIEEIILDMNIPNNEKSSRCIKIVEEFHEKFLKEIKELNFTKIGVPGKWSKNDFTINAMKIYNFITNSSNFGPGSSGLFIYTKFHTPSKLKGIENINLKKINGICVPYNYDENMLQQKLNEFGISIDIESQWNKLYTTTCDRIIKLANMISKKKN